MDRSSPLYTQRFWPCKELLIASLPILVMSVVMSGIRPLLVIIFSMLCALGFDWFMHKMRANPFYKLDFSPLVTGMVLAMLLPASVSLWIVLVGNFVAIVMVKHAFGGYGSNMFNPAAVGIAFLCLMWPDQVFNYPTPFTNVPLFVGEKFSLISSPLATLKAGGVPYLQRSELLIGNFAGPIGAAGIVIMAGCAAYLIIRRVIDWRLSASFLSAVALMAFFFPRIHATRLDSMLYELFCSATVFCALFVISDPVTAPKRPLSKYIYGALIGIVAMLFRYYGAYEIGVPFACIAISALSSFIDRRVGDYEGRYTVSKQIVSGDGI